jgi:hypothetical protein
MTIDDHSFSEQLRLHASSLDLESIGPVGDWDFGQSIRRAKDKSFFYDLSAHDFYPLGLNHPLMIRSTIIDPSPCAIPSTLTSKLAGLAGLKWVVLSANTYDQFKQGKQILEHEAFTLHSLWGLRDFEKIQSTSISVRLGDGFWWVLSSLELPSSDTQSHHGWLNLFLSTDVLGPEGRLAKVQKIIMRYFRLSQMEGLSFQTTGSAAKLALLGIRADQISATEVAFHFPVSVLQADIEKIHQLITSKEALC